MSTKVYAYKMAWGEILRIQADLTQASAPIRVEGAEEGEYGPTPFQTATAEHREATMVRMVIRYLGSEWYGAPSSALTDEEQLDDAIEGMVAIEE